MDEVTSEVRPQKQVVRLREKHAGLNRGEVAGFSPDEAHRLVLLGVAEPMGWTPDPDVMRRAAAAVFDELQSGLFSDKGNRALRVYQRIATALGVPQPMAE